MMGRIKYDYTLIALDGRFALRPMVDVTVLAQNGEAMRASALIDTGADVCLFPLNVARVLRLNLRALPTAPTSGVGNAANLTYYDNLTIDLGNGVIFETRIGFTEGLDRFGFGLLGQQGLFENYTVEFRHRDRIFTIESA